MKKDRLVLLIGRLGLASVFLYAGISSFLKPSDWIGYIPSWATNFASLPAQTLLASHAVIEILLGIAFVLGFQVRLAATIATADLLAILIAIGINSVTFRDFGLIALSLTLALQKTKKN